MDTTQTISRRRVLQSAAAVCLARPLRASDPTFAADVNVVNVFVTVRDKKGAIVTDLAKDDFVLSEEGHEQTIRYFNRQQSAADIRFAGGYNSERNEYVAIERNASSLFFEKVLRLNQDKAFLIQFADDVQLLQDLTSSRASLEKALNLLEEQDQPHLRRASDNPDDAPAAPHRAGRGGGADSTVLSDAIYLGADEILKSQTVARQ